MIDTFDPQKQLRFVRTDETSMLGCSKFDMDPQKRELLDANFTRGKGWYYASKACGRSGIDYHHSW